MKFKLRRYYLYYLARSAAFIFSLIPLKVGLFLAQVLGDAAFYAAGKYRRIAIENLTFVFGAEMTTGEIKSLARKVFENLAKNAVELVNFPKINQSNIDKFVQIRGREHLDKAFEAGNGIIIITAHFGNWELMGATLRLKGCPGVIVGRRIYFDKYDRFLNRLRKIQDVNVIYRDESPRKILKVLKENRIVGIVADQDVDSVEGVFVDFLGRQAYTPIGPVALAKTSSAALVPVFMRRSNKGHLLTVEEPIQLADTGDKDKDTRENTHKWSRVIESYVRRYPEQWVWMHKRWKTKKIKNLK